MSNEKFREEYKKELAIARAQGYEVPSFTQWLMQTNRAYPDLPKKDLTIDDLAPLERPNYGAGNLFTKPGIAKAATKQPIKITKSEITVDSEYDAVSIADLIAEQKEDESFADTVFGKREVSYKEDHQKALQEEYEKVKKLQEEYTKKNNDFYSGLKTTEDSVSYLLEKATLVFNNFMLCCTPFGWVVLLKGDSWVDISSGIKNSPSAALLAFIESRYFVERLIGTQTKEILHVFDELPEYKKLRDEEEKAWKANVEEIEKEKKTREVDSERNILFLDLLEAVENKNFDLALKIQEEIRQSHSGVESTMVIVDDVLSPEGTEIETETYETKMINLVGSKASAERKFHEGKAKSGSSTAVVHVHGTYMGEQEKGNNGNKFHCIETDDGRLIAIKPDTLTFEES